MCLNRFGQDFQLIRQEEIVDLKGKISAANKAVNPWAVQNLKKAVFSIDTVINPGEVIFDKAQGIYYFAYTVQAQYIKNNLVIQAINLLRSDKICQIQRLEGQTGVFGGTKQSFGVKASEIRCHLREVSSDLRTERPALLERAAFLLYLQGKEDLQTLDRVAIEEVNYQAEHIDKLTQQGLIEAELNLDNR